MDVDLKTIRDQRSWYGMLLSQDLHDFSCHGNMMGPEREARFKELLKIYSSLMKEETRLWQIQNGYLKPPQEDSHE